MKTRVDSALVSRGIAASRLKMEGAHRNAVLGKFLEPALRLHNHKVGIHRGPGDFAELVDDRESERDVGHQGAVHNVKVDDVTADIDEFDVLLQMKEIRSEN